MVKIKLGTDHMRLSRRQHMAESHASTPSTDIQPRRQRGNGRIFKRKGSPFYWLAYYLRGKEYRESTGTEDEKQAERFLKRRIKEVGADQIDAKPFGGPQQDRLTINQLLDALK